MNRNGGAVPVAGHALVVAFSVAFPERLPAASAASTASVYDVPHARLPNVYVVPVAVPTCVPPRYRP